MLISAAVAATVAVSAAVPTTAAAADDDNGYNNDDDDGDGDQNDDDGGDEDNDDYDDDDDCDNLNFLVVFTRGQFWPSGIVVACVCLCVRPPVRVCGNHLLVRAITHHPFKLGSPNLDHRCKRPWLRSLLFWGWLTLTFKVKFNSKVKRYPILSLSAQ